MRGWQRWLGVLLVAVLGCGRPARSAQNSVGKADTGSKAPAAATHAGEFVGFDRNDYPGDQAMQRLHGTFAFTGYWLTNPPGETGNSWVGKRATLRAQGWGFLVLANGRLDREILQSAKGGASAEHLGRQDAAAAVASARREGFPANTILFLDQEEGGRLITEQAAYLLAWTEAVARSGFRPGAYASGQEVEDDPGQRIDTVQDIRARVKAGKLQEVAIFDALDQCPPAPGCTLQPRPLSAAPDPDVVVWQYAQSPRRPAITKSCAATYAPDGNCYAPGFPQLFLDMNAANSTDPSHGR